MDLVEFMTLRQPYYLESIWVFYSNLWITDNWVINNEVKRITFRIDPSLFFGLTNLGSQGRCFEENMIDEWKLNYSSQMLKLWFVMRMATLVVEYLLGLWRLKNVWCTILFVASRCPVVVTLHRPLKKTLFWCGHC